jgi:Dolichyl-phosphate-mannose-protein mannosyltransferase
MKNISFVPDKLLPYISGEIKIILWFFLPAAVVIFLLSGLVSISFPYSLDYGEAPLIDQAMRLAAGENIYRPNIDTPPYTIANYPPGYVIALVPFLNWSDSPFVMGRTISLLATMLSAAFIGLTIYSFSADRLSALTAALFFLASPYVVQWSGLARIDSLALAFATGALFVLARWPQKRWSWLVAGIALVAAAYTRQSYALAAPLAALVWLWTQNKRRTIELFLLVAGLGVVLFFVINLLTNGGFYYNIVTANVNEFGSTRLSDHLSRLWEENWIILLLGGLFLGLGWRSQKSWPLVAPFLVGASISALTIGKIGSNVNYFLELAAALAMVAGIVMIWSRPYPWRNAAFILLISIQFGILFSSSMGNNVDWILATHQRDFTALQLLEQEVIKMPEPVLADEDMGLLTMNGQRLYLQPFEVTQLAKMDEWDEQLLLDEIAAHKFGGILIHHFGVWPVHKERWSPRMLAAIDTHYRPVKTLAGTVIYVPGVETDIAPVPAPVQIDSAVDPVVWDGKPIQVGTAGFLAEPSIAINPTDPAHLTAIATSFSKSECELPNCKVELAFYTSTDGGDTWQDRVSLARPEQAMTAGLVTFDPDGKLYILSLRGDAIVLEQATREDDYLPAQIEFEEVTRAQVAARPWLRVNPQSGELFLSFDAQEGDMLFTTPSLIRSDDGVNWSLTSRADQHVSVVDIFSPRATGPGDIQVLFGQGDNVSLVWVWDAEPWTWPRTVWMANSSDNGTTFDEPTALMETWGPIQTASANGQMAIVYRPGSERLQSLAVATTSDGGQTWSSATASGDVPLYFDVDKASAVSIAPNGTLDLVFYAHTGDSASCLLDIESWRMTLAAGRVDPCEYDVFYTYSNDGGRAFASPLKLNQQPIRGADFVQYTGASPLGSPLAVSSSNDYAYPVWIGTPQVSKTQVFTAKIAR